MTKYVYEIEYYYSGWHKLFKDGVVFSSKKKAEQWLAKNKNKYCQYQINKKEVV